MTAPFHFEEVAPHPTSLRPSPDLPLYGEVANAIAHADESVPDGLPSP